MLDLNLVLLEHLVLVVLLCLCKCDVYFGHALNHLDLCFHKVLEDLD